MREVLTGGHPAGTAVLELHVDQVTCAHHQSESGSLLPRFAEN